ncbi:MAG: hypothetical protein HY074_06795 [Deltaproteobacteria bacterium]|nr:hypothetical protein [Deltaproteobacteria bacterium]
MDFTRPLKPLSIALLLLSACAATAGTKPKVDYTPTRSRLLPDKSVELKEHWDQDVRFLYNRGEGAVHFQDELLELLSPANIAKTNGFQSPAKTRITLMTYEFRSQEVFDRIKALLKLGYNVRVVSDSSTFTLAQLPSQKQWKAWSQTQREYFLNRYDHDRDGQVSQEDLDHANEVPFVSNAFWNDLQELVKRNPKSLELIATPYEAVPANDSSLYTRLSHLKRNEIAVMQADGKWLPEVVMLSSANLTYGCLDCMIGQGKENLSHYVKGEDYTKARGSEGHIQFGAIIKGAEAIAAISGPTEEWIALYKQGKHFDSAHPKDKQLPRVVFDELGNRTTLQAFYSEGTLLQARAADDPVWAITSILSRPENELKVFYDAQFVFTHKNIARHLRHHLINGGIEAFGVFVDANFATAVYSALPDLLFAHKLQNALLVSPENALQKFAPVPDELHWTDNVFVFNGRQGVSGGNGDKLHSKVSYFEYLDGQKVRHYVVAWGSANKSTNAGKLNADGLFVLDSLDPNVGRQVRPFFEGLREEKRMQPYSQAYLEERLLELLKPSEEIFHRSAKGYFVDELAEALTQSVPRARLRQLLETMQAAGPVNANGSNFLALLEWYVDHGPIDRPFTWSDFHLALELTNPNLVPQEGLVTAAGRLWAGEKPGAKTIKAFDTTLTGMSRGAKAAEMKLAPELVEIMGQCEAVLTRLNFPIYKGGKKP